MTWHTAVIGTVLMNPSSMVEAETLLPSDFSGDDQAVWAEMLSLHRNNSLDLRTLSMILAENHIIPIPETYLHRVLEDRVGNISEAVRRVEDEAVRKNLKKNAALIAAEADNQARTVQELTDYAEQRILSSRRDRSNGQSLADVISLFMPRMEGMIAGTFHPAWVPKVDAVRQVLKYAEDTDLIIVAGRPGEGKSSYARFEAYHHAANGHPVLIFNYDNDPIEFARWFIAIDTGIDAGKMKDPRFLTAADLTAVRHSAESLVRLPLYIESERGDAAWIKRTTRRHVAEHHIELGIVDYIQQVMNGHEKRNDDVSITTASIRDLNQQLRIPFIGNSQMNREVERRGRESGPTLTDLRDSGSIEQDGTIVVFPYGVWSDPTDAQLRQFPENIDQRNGRTFGRPKAVPVQFIVAKNRNGECGKSSLVKWVKSNNRYEAIIE
jgi:replicative DNA helicase